MCESCQTWLRYSKSYEALRRWGVELLMTFFVVVVYRNLYTIFIIFLSMVQLWDAIYVVDYYFFSFSSCFFLFLYFCEFNIFFNFHLNLLFFQHIKKKIKIIIIIIVIYIEVFFRFAFFLFPFLCVQV